MVYGTLCNDKGRAEETSQKYIAFLAIQGVCDGIAMYDCPLTAYATLVTMQNVRSSTQKNPHLTVVKRGTCP